MSSDTRSEVGQWPNRLLTCGWIAVALPVVASLVSAVQRGWAPAGDAAIVAAKVADTLTSDPPLVGGWTSLGRFDDEPLHHAGPLGIWVLAAPTRILGDPGAGLVVGAALVSMASLGALAACVRRWREPNLEVLFLGFTALMVASLGGDRLIDPNAPQIGVMPLLVVLVATVGVLAGHDRQLWALVAAGSLASQTHLGYLPLIGVMVVLAVAWLLVDTRRHPAARPRRWTRDVPVAVAIGLVAWVGPIVDQVAGSRNLTRLVAERIGSDDPSQGFGEAFRLLVAYTTVPARWMGERAQNVPLDDPSASEVIVSLTVLAVAVAGFVDAVRRRDRVRRSLGAVALVAVPVAIISSAGVTAIAIGQGLLYYRLFWWPVGVLVATLCASSIVRWVEVGLDRRGDAPTPGPALVAAAGGVSVLALALVGVGYRSYPASSAAQLDVVVERAREVAELDGTDNGVVVLLEEPEGSAIATDELAMLLLAPTFVAELRLLGIDVRFPPGPFDARYGPVSAYQYERPAEGDESIVVLFRAGAGVDADPPKGFALLSADGFGVGSSDPAPPVASAVFVATD